MGNERHVDHTLLTVALAGSAVGLGRVRDEALMRPHQVCLFAGDALSFRAAGALPALLHRVASTHVLRLSIPFPAPAARALDPTHRRWRAAAAAAERPVMSGVISIN